MPPDSHTHPSRRAGAPGLLPAFEWTPGRITLLYLLFGFAALFLSDVLIVGLLEDPLLSTVQAAKGGVEVLATGAFIFVLTRRSRGQLQRTNDRLKRQREELEVLHRVLRHDLRNALTVISGTADHLNRDPDVEDFIGEQCRRIERRAERLAQVVEQASRIHRISETSGPRVTLDLDETIRTAVARVDIDDVILDVPADERVVVNRLFEQAITELVSNAVRHDESGPPRVSISAERIGEWVHVQVSDDGPGIPERVREVFEHGEFDQLLHLDGMGLWFVYWTIEDTGGTFEIETDQDGGTTVHLTVPRATEAAVESDPPKPA